MGTRVTQYTDPQNVGYAYRRHDGTIGVTKNLAKAQKGTVSGIARICFADHCRLGDDESVVIFSSRDQSYAALSHAVEVAVERDDDGYYWQNFSDEPVDFV